MTIFFDKDDDFDKEIFGSLVLSVRFKLAITQVQNSDQNAPIEVF